MKKKLAIFSILTILAMSLAITPTYAHSGHSKAGAIVAGSIAGLAVGTILGSSISSHHHVHKPIHHHRGTIHPRHHHHGIMPPPPPSFHRGGFYSTTYYTYPTHSHSYVTFGW